MGLMGALNLIAVTLAAILFANDDDLTCDSGYELRDEGDWHDPYTRGADAASIKENVAV